MINIFLFLLVTFVLLSAPVHAGQLFPPANSGGAASCVNGQVLKWVNNSVYCDDPTPGVTINCPNPDQILVGVKGGTAICTSIPTASTSSLTISCPAGQILTGINKGVAVCATPTSTGVTVTCPAGQVLTGITNGTPVCVSYTALEYAFGGTYTKADYDEGYSCAAPNHLTGACSCPAGFKTVGLTRAPYVRNAQAMNETVSSEVFIKTKLHLFICVKD